jgi:predicted CoA-substrate-specific enzyme activase
MNPSDITGVGLDLGSTTAKFVRLEAGKVVKKDISPSFRWKEFVDENLGDPNEDIYSTGYFRRSVAHKVAVTEITAAKKGVAFLMPDDDIDVILDIGGQDTKVIEIKTNRFILNDKCSAGTGAFLEFTAKYFNIPLEELNVLHKQATRPVRINNTCGVFAITEMISHLVNGAERADVIAGMHLAWAMRIAQLLPEELETLAIIGGGARNTGVCDCLKEELAVSCGKKINVLIPGDPDLVNAVGAVIYGLQNPGS